MAAYATVIATWKTDGKASETVFSFPEIALIVKEATMELKDYYQIMGFKRDATQDEIKRACRRLAHKYHPDVSKEKDAESRFKEVGEAYEVLKDPEKRAAYDQLGSNWKAGQEFRPPPDWDQGFEFRGGFTGAEQFSDFFESLFGGGAFGSGFGHFAQWSFDARGEDTYTNVLIDLDDAHRAANRTLTLKQTEPGMDVRPQVQERTLNGRIPEGARGRDRADPGRAQSGLSTPRGTGARAGGEERDRAAWPRSGPLAF
jgi:curved DNA-binding protein